MDAMICYHDIKECNTFRIKIRFSYNSWRTNRRNIEFIKWKFSKYWKSLINLAADPLPFCNGSVNRGSKSLSRIYLERWIDLIRFTFISFARVPSIRGEYVAGNGENRRIRSDEEEQREKAKMKIESHRRIEHARRSEYKSRDWNIFSRNRRTYRTSDSLSI